VSYFEPRYYTSGNAAHALLGDPAAEEREDQKRNQDAGVKNLSTIWLVPPKCHENLA
jgi:hypothetical protein